MRRLELSPYYPPRARRHRPLTRLLEGIRRLAWLDRIHLPGGISFKALVAALFIPGLAFRLQRERLAARAIWVSYILLACVLVVWLGRTAANLAFGLMLSLHTISVLCLLGPWLNQARLVFRIMAGVAILLVLGGLLYLPLRDRIQRTWLLPVRLEGRVIVVQTLTKPESVKRGEWIAYRIQGGSARGLVIQSGLAVQRVLGLPGDEIRFSSQALFINGVAGPRLEHMPVTGKLIVPEKHWFIWPDHAMSVRGNNAERVDAALFGLADVKQDQFVGKPFRRWFWRRQTLP